MHPIFYGCYDWHSAVHSCWQVLRAVRIYPAAPFAADVMTLLTRNFTAENVAGEMAYLANRTNFEMPYGMAWLLQLLAELREMKTAQTTAWAEILQPLEAHATERFRSYLSKLPYPIRTGTHNQTAFAMGLVLDWTRTAGDDALAELIADCAHHFFAQDVDVPMAYEPSGSDFLSPALAEADLMRRVLERDAFEDWLTAFLRNDGVAQLSTLLSPVSVVDFADGQLAHFAGLNMSRAWMLEGIADALGDAHPLQTPLLALAHQHQESGLGAALHEDYMVSHWAPTFALYLLTKRGIAEQ